MLHTALALAVLAPTNPEALKDVVVDRDNITVTESCRLIVPEGKVIRDADGNGVIQVAADGITIEMGDGTLRGAEPGTPHEIVHGIAVSINGHDNVTLRGLRVAGFKGGVVATDADGLTIDGGSFSDGYAMHLKSTAEAENTDDWLWPHNNDGGEWYKRYGGQITITDADNVTVRGATIRSSQNGIVLSNVENSSVYDNDASFLSGWGIAMWRSSGNTVTRNATDFCIRGYSHGKYNRGQDSAGILMFEQCSDNLIADNSATHCGDGIFIFAGRDALGEGRNASEIDRKRLGCNDNRILNNDFSYAAAHGLELTFSFGNVVAGNRLSGNAICGIWGGYSQDNVIAKNTIENNGRVGAGEGGGINIEHGAGNVIRENNFAGNSVGVYLWTDADEALRATPWAKANYRGSVDNLIAKNTFDNDTVAIKLRDTGATAVAANTYLGVDTEIEATDGSAPDESMVTMEVFDVPSYAAKGENSPIGARAARGGRNAILMGEYFPWDGDQLIFRAVNTRGSTHTYEVYGGSEMLWAALTSPTASLRWTSPDTPGDPTIMEVNGPAGVHPYKLRIAENGKLDKTITGTLIRARWRMQVFSYENDPRENLEAWRAESEGDNAKRARTSSLDFDFGGGSPSDLDLSGAVIRAKFSPDHFGIIAKATVPMAKGHWRFRTRSDDGVRVMVDGKTILENWTHHGAETDTGEFTVDEDRDVEFTVEYFELTGAATLSVDLEMVDDAS